MFKILDDDRFNDIGVAAAKTKEYSKARDEYLEMFEKIDEILKDSEEGKELLQELDCLSSLMCSYECEFFYEQGFKDSAEFFLEGNNKLI